MAVGRSVKQKGRPTVAGKEGIPQGVREYRFQGVANMERVIESHMDLLSNQNNKGKEKSLSASQDECPSEFIVFTGVPSDVLEHNAIEKKFSSYHKQLKILVLKMVLRPHERASRVFERLLQDAIRPMGLEEQIGLDGTARIHGLQRDKEPDCSYRPRILPAGRATQWPSMVVEVADSESQNQVDADAHWWLENSNGDVKIAITISIRRARITIRRWETIDRPTRANPYRTVTKLMQEVNIVRQPNGSITTMGTAPLRLPFEKVMLRRPSMPLEGDFLILDEALKELGQEVWEVQEQ
ncbi:conserved hypothetical protein [Histoplasma capsulatum G186AR]|uniref:Uncharacterized protein n=1 Tax=Ajellomyces capsulatus (strain G186AR / H82 / ATCC MYA-2454 / RMSCC 2432) TaxID=447093 RepID=C0NUM1_AJECG|nr:uncharacterized protein HCBG_07052 [Histoplasma capsulatum G186AR]EEH05101.1 conserved hypothetical protein [Histoplasma capsulatum G186AR]